MDWSPLRLSNLRNSDLSDELRAQGLPSSGNKAQLIDRLVTNGNQNGLVPITPAVRNFLLPTAFPQLAPRQPLALQPRPPSPRRPPAVIQQPPVVIPPPQVRQP